VIDLGSLSGVTDPADAQANAINNVGQVAGSSRLPPGSGSSAFPHAFIYDHGKMTDLGMLPGWEWSVGSFINDAGEVVGTVHAGNHAVGCFIYTGGAMKDMGVLGNAGSYPYCQVYGINNSGVAVGYTNAIPTPPDFQTTGPFVYSDGHMTNLNTLIVPTDALITNHIVLKNAISINDNGQILATTGTPASEGVYYLLTPVENSAPTPTPDPTPTPAPAAAPTPAPVATAPPPITASIAVPETTMNNEASGKGAFDWLLLSLLGGSFIWRKQVFPFNR
jgi:probable HAF family extracellular repeat protein